MKEKNKILIVEDDVLNQQVYKRSLSKDYILKICGDTKGFYAALMADTYDLFIVDLALNCEKDGIDLIKELRQMNHHKGTPIIVVTAFAFSKDKENAMAAGATQFIIKPFDNKKLLEEIKKYF